MTYGSFARPVQIGACALGVWLLGPLILSEQPTLIVGSGLFAQSNGVPSPGTGFVNTADPAAPNAKELVVDVPSVFHWARYQRGEINGWRYVLYPDGSGVVARVGTVLERPFTMDCQAGMSCKITRPDETVFNVEATFAKRPDIPVNPQGEGVAQYLAEWVLAGSGMPAVVDLPLRLDLPKLAERPPLPKPAAPQIAVAPLMAVAEVLDIAPVIRRTANAAAGMADGAIAGAVVAGKAVTREAVAGESLAGAGHTGEVIAAVAAAGEAKDVPATQGNEPPTVLAETEVAKAAEAEAALVLAEAEVPEPEPEPEPDGPAQLCAEPDPFIPSLCLDPQPVAKRAAPATSLGGANAGQAVSDGDGGGTSNRRKTGAASKPDKPDGFLDRVGLDCSLTGSTSLGYVASGSSRSSIGKPRVSLGCNKKITDKLSLRFSLLKYVIPGHQTDYDPDFTYAFTYRHSDDLTFNYANYSGQFGGETGGLLKALADGTLRGSYKLPKIKLPNDKETACSASFRLPNPINDSLNISCGYAVTDKLRVNGTLNLYRPTAQGEYDPDYTYTASYKVNKDLIITYSNYSNNRFAWNKGKSPGPGLSGGSLSFSYDLKF